MQKKNILVNNITKYLPSYYDKLIIPTLFYNAVIERNVNKVNMIIKYNPVLSVNVALFYDIILKSAFFYKKSGIIYSPYRIKWNTKTDNQKIIMKWIDLANLYNYITVLPWGFTNMGFLINCINNYLVQLRSVMYLINNHIPANNFFYLGVNVNNNIEMKYYIARFIPGYRQ